MTTMIERVARAICDATGEFSWDEEDEITRSEFRNEAIAAIEAMREPTEAMIEAGHWHSGSDAGPCFTAMIDAALKEESP